MSKSSIPDDDVTLYSKRGSILGCLRNKGEKKGDSWMMMEYEGYEINIEEKYLFEGCWNTWGMLKIQD